jgi:hypothetical protein
MVPTSQLLRNEEFSFLTGSGSQAPSRLDSVKKSISKQVGVMLLLLSEVLPLKQVSGSKQLVADISCVTGLPAWTKYRSCRLFLPFSRWTWRARIGRMVA